MVSKAQEFLSNKGCSDLILNGTGPLAKEVRVCASDIMTDFSEEQIKALKAENERLKSIIFEHEQWAKSSYKQTTKIFDFVKSKPAGKPLHDQPRAK